MEFALNATKFGVFKPKLPDASAFAQLHESLRVTESFCSKQMLALGTGVPDGVVITPLQRGATSRISKDDEVKPPVNAAPDTVAAPTASMVTVPNGTASASEECRPILHSGKALTWTWRSCLLMS